MCEQCGIITEASGTGALRGQLVRGKKKPLGSGKVRSMKQPGFLGLTRSSPLLPPAEAEGIPILELRLALAAVTWLLTSEKH